MPARGVPNNPQGVNGFSGFAPPEPQYGDIQRTQQLERSAPVATPNRNAPQRAQRKAVRGASPAQIPQQGLPAPQPTPEAALLAAGQQIAAIPGVSDLVKELVNGGTNRAGAP